MMRAGRLSIALSAFGTAPVLHKLRAGQDGCTGSPIIVSDRRLGIACVAQHDQAGGAVEGAEKQDLRAPSRMRERPDVQ